MMKKNILSISDVDNDIGKIIEFGIRLKNDKKNGKDIDYLKKKILVLIFERASIRTRISFEIGMKYLGGQVVFLTKDNIQMGIRESVEDVAKILSRYADIVVYRALDKKDLYELAKHATIPVINGLDRDEHPCQILADLMTIKEKKGTLENLNFVFIGDGDDNLTHSYLLGCSQVGMNVTVISPKKYWPKNYFVEKARDIANKKKLKLTITDDIEAIKDADIVATDTWTSLWDEKEKQNRIKDFKNYTITPEIMKKAKEDAIFLHCMPIYYEEEVVKDVAYGPQSAIIDEAENHIWVQMALMIKLLN
jgi:ornithine carbamoyltransferase